MEKKIDVLSISTSDVTGGAAVAAFRIHQSINKANSNVSSKMLVKHKLSKDDNVYPITQFLPKNILFKVYSFISNKLKNRYYHYLWTRYPHKDNVFLSDLRSTPLMGALNKIHHDIIHLNWFNLRYLNINLLVKNKKPIIWTLHDSWAFTGICHYFYDCEAYKQHCGNCPFLHSNDKKDLSFRVWKKKNRVYSQLNLHIVTPSQWLADLVKQSSLLKAFPVSVIPNCLDTSVYLPGDKIVARKKLNLSQKATVVLFGAVNPTQDKHKGFEYLLEAMKVLEQHNNSFDITLAIFGTDQPIPFETKFPIQYLGYLRTDTELVTAYQAADVMIVPSLSEVFGQTASEAMACGVPVVAFNCSGIKEVVDHLSTGYLAEAYSSTDLANGIHWCLENNKTGILSTNARQKVLENFTEEIVGEKYREMYEEIMGKTN